METCSNQKNEDIDGKTLPLQLRKPEFRFVLIHPIEKAPFEKDWQSTNNYQYNNEKLLSHMAAGGNYGVVCGYGNLVVIDADTEEVKKSAIANLPATLTVETGSGGAHFYYLCPDLDKPIRLRKTGSKTVGDIGDVQFTGKQVLGPGSIHPNGNLYEVVNNVPIQTIFASQLKFALKDFIVKEDEKAKEVEEEQAKKLSVNIDKLSIVDILNLSKLKKRGNEYQGAHPIHGSRTGQNFCVNDAKNVWHCFRCDSGGGPLSWIAVQEGIIECSKAVHGVLHGDIFKKVLKVAEEKYNLEIPKKKCKKEEKLDIQQVLQYPDWGLDGKIVNPILLDKNVAGKRKIFIFKVYINETGGLQTEQINAALFIPPTRMMPTALDMGEFAPSMIFEKLKALMNHHLYFTEDIHYDLQTLAAMSSYFREVFDTYPYMDYFSAEIGVGKTHAMLCLIYASFHGFAMVIPTEAVLFRSVEDAHATIGIDEVHKLFKNPNQHQDLLSLLLSGHTKGIGTYRIDMNAQPPRLIQYDPFGIKAFTRKGYIPIDLLSRAISFNMMNARKRKIIDEHLTPEEFAECRNMMYIYRLKHWQEVRAVYDTLRDEKVLEGRQADLFLPLLTIAKLCSDELYTKVLKYAKEDETKRFAVKHDERVVVLIEYLKDKQHSGEVKVKDIRNGLQERLHDAGLMNKDEKLTSQTVMGWLNSLGFDKSQKRAQNCAHYVIDSKRLDAWHQDVVMEEKKEEPPKPILPTQTNLTNLTETNQPEKKTFNDKVRFGEVSEVCGGAEEEGVERVEAVESEMCIETEKNDNKFGKWMIDHYKNHRGIPRDVFVNDVLMNFPESIDPEKIREFYDMLKQQENEVS